MQATDPRLPDRQADLDWLLRLLEREKEDRRGAEQERRKDAPGAAPRGLKLRAEDCRRPLQECSDEELVERARGATNGNRLRDLLGGGPCGYESDSEADAAAVGMLAFWCGPGEAGKARAWRILQDSGRRRDKLDRKDYRARTLAKGYEGVTTYHGDYDRTPRAAHSGREQPHGGRQGPPLPPDDAELLITVMSSVQMRAIQWDAPGYTARGKLNLFAGEGGEGKSTLLLDYLACKTTGRACFGLDYRPSGPSDVLAITCEDDLADTLKPRLLAAGADMARVHHCNAIRGGDGKPIPFNLAYVQQLRRYLKAHPAIDTILIDPVSAFIGGIDDHRDNELRAVLTPLADLAAELNVTILLVKHLSKTGTSKAVHRIAGSVAYVNTCRAVFIVVRDDEDENKRLILPAKFNLGVKPAGLVFQPRPLLADEAAEMLAPFDYLGDEDRAALQRQLFKVDWCGTTDRSADDVLGGNQPGARGGKRDAARDWLLGVLAKGAMPQVRLFDLAQKQGYSERTMYRVKKACPDVQSHKLMSLRWAWAWGIGPPTEWILQGEDCQPLG